MEFAQSSTRCRMRASATAPSFSPPDKCCAIGAAWADAFVCGRHIAHKASAHIITSDILSFIRYLGYLYEYDEQSAAKRTYCYGKVQGGSPKLSSSSRPNIPPDNHLHQIDRLCSKS